MLSSLPILPAADYRIPQWNALSETPRACPFCGTYSAPLFLRPDRLPIARCATCSCYYVAVALGEETLTTFYARYWQDTCPRHLTAELARYLKYSARARLLSDPCLLKATALLGTWDGKKVLDVGCGFGEKASIMQGLGAQVNGIDISESAVAFCKDLLGIQTAVLRPEQVHDIETYDVVTMFEFCEHPLNPLAAIRSVMGALRNGGYLILVTPNGTAGDAVDIQGGHEWLGFRVDLEHMQYLHVDTIAFLAQRLRCRVVHLEQFGYRTLGEIRSGPPKRALSHYLTLKRHLKGIPGVRKSVYWYRNVQARMRSSVSPSHKSGTYHLFAVLQKVGQT